MQLIKYKLRTSQTVSKNILSEKTVSKNHKKLPEHTTTIQSMK